MKRIAFLIALFVSAGIAATSEARPLGIWSKMTSSVKTTLGPKGRNVRLSDRGTVATIPPGGSITPAPETCYDYAFVSRRERNVDNIFFAGTCTPELRQGTSNTSNRIAYSALSGAINLNDVAGVEIDLTDPSLPRPYLTIWTNAGGGLLPYYRFWERAHLSSPAFGLGGSVAMVTTDLNWQNAVVRVGDVFSDGATDPQVILPDDPNDTRTLGRVAWITTSDTSSPGFNKLVVSMRRGGYYEEGRVTRDDVDRLFVLDAASGELAPLKDSRDFANIDFAMEGKEPAVSRNGRQLAFIRNVYGLNRLWTCDLTLEPASGEGGGYQCANAQMMNTDIHEPESLSGNYDWPCWSYDSKKIFFSFDGLRASTDNHPYSKIYMVNPDGTSLRRLNDGNADGTDNTDNDSYPACLPPVYHVVTEQKTVSVMPVREEYHVVPATQTVTVAPFRCDATHACPTGMVCGTDNICRTATSETMP